MKNSCQAMSNNSFRLNIRVKAIIDGFLLKNMVMKEKF